MSAEYMTIKKFNELFDRLMISPMFEKLFLSSNGKCIPFNRISDLQTLKTLFICDEGISDIEALRGMNNLQYVYLFNNNISDVSPLYGLTEIRRLQLDDNKIDDLTPLISLTGLTHLSLLNTHLSAHNITILNTIAHTAPNIKFIWVDDNDINRNSLNNDIDVFQFVDLNRFVDWESYDFYQHYSEDVIRLNRYVFTNYNNIDDNVCGDTDSDDDSYEDEHEEQTDSDEEEGGEGEERGGEEND
jgi:Leucine-rich repeat (LRR) protein